MWRKYLWCLFALVIVCSTAAVARLVKPAISGPALTQCQDDVSDPACYHDDTTMRSCCIPMGSGRYLEEEWEVKIYRHPNAPKSKWYVRWNRIDATGLVCTPLQPLKCRPIPDP